MSGHIAANERGWARFWVRLSAVPTAALLSPTWLLVLLVSIPIAVLRLALSIAAYAWLADRLFTARLRDDCPPGKPAYVGAMIWAWLMEIALNCGCGLVILPFLGAVGAEGVLAVLWYGFLGSACYPTFLATAWLLTVVAVAAGDRVRATGRPLSSEGL